MDFRKVRHFLRNIFNKKKKAILYGLMLKLVIDKKAERVSGAFKFVPFLQRV